MRQLDPRTAILGGKAQLKTLCDIRGLAGVPADRQAMWRLVGQDARPYRLLPRRIALEDATAGAQFYDAIDRGRGGPLTRSSRILRSGGRCRATMSAAPRPRSIAS